MILLPYEEMGDLHMAIKSQKIVADFETTTDKNDLRVWAVCAVDIETAETVYLSNSLGDFIEWLSNKNTVCYFHNLKFDIEFILYYIQTELGFRYAETGEAGTYKTLITDTGVFYSCTVYFEKQNKKYKKVVFYDSLKKLPFKVSVISKAFELQDEKLEIDYHAYREPGHELTEEEKAYIVNDCRIVAQALKIQFDEGLTKMTNASDAMNGFKHIISKEQFEYLFPVFPEDMDASIRRAYKGGYVYLNAINANRRGLAGRQYDVNSLYPWAMYNCLLPYGYPRYFEGEPVKDDKYPLYIVRMRCAFKVKPRHLPTIQLKSNFAFVPTEYLESTWNAKQGLYEIVDMTLTNVDLELFKDHYDIMNEEYLDGWKFKGAVGLFKDYIDYWMHIKETTTGARRQLAKLMLNSLYGKFATNPRDGKKIPYYDPEEDLVKYAVPDKKNRVPQYDPATGKLKMVEVKVENRDPVYTAMGAFITAYAREKTIRSAQANYDRFIYADTDSLKLIGYEEPTGLDVHPTRLGAWKDEGNFSDSIFIRAKTYMMTVDGKIKVTCAGMPENVKEAVTYENFHSGATFDGKLMPRRYPGGIVLEETTFTIK